MNSKYPYLLAIILGIVIPFFPEFEPYPITLGLFYLYGGSLFGFFWPKESWRWGIWIASPMIVFMGLIVLFGGKFDIFLKKDLPILLLAIIPACVGSFLFALFKHRHAKGTQK